MALANVQGFFAFGPSGVVDVRKTVKNFEDALKAHLKAQEDLKPAILQELREYKRLGELKLINYTMHALRMPSTTESEERVKAAIKDLEADGTITYTVNESGTRKGKNAGWVLSSSPEAAAARG